MRFRLPAAGGSALRAARTLAALAALPLLALPLGCQDQSDSGLAPGSGTPGDADAQALRDQAVGALQFVNGFVGQTAALSSGDFSGLNGSLGLPAGTPLRTAGEPAWDAAQGAWVLDDSGSEIEDGATLVWDAYVFLQFRDGTGAPQQEPDATTASFAYDVAMTLDLHGEQDGEVVDLGLDIDFGMAMDGLPDGPFALEGDGSMALDMAWSSPGETPIELAATMGWTVDLTLADAAACPVGTAGVTVENVQVDATYDGDATAAWALREDGVVVESGIESVACGSAS